ncbi:hypothetical protein ILUMI_10318 [Ignelater luminosus]|uniref:Uncharacterized protein n=1 Tax=Ignelater luminosus TaxID=2038154 RepID=A0A8K0D7C9_IGNLU|nr:hypothetical protein ILUMI_10318 [Ignelater luminosus]
MVDVKAGSSKKRNSNESFSNESFGQKSTQSIQGMPINSMGVESRRTCREAPEKLRNYEIEMLGIIRFLKLENRAKDKENNELKRKVNKTEIQVEHINIRENMNRGYANKGLLKVIGRNNSDSIEACGGIKELKNQVKEKFGVGGKDKDQFISVVLKSGKAYLQKILFHYNNVIDVVDTGINQQLVKKNINYAVNAETADMM